MTRPTRIKLVCLLSLLFSGPRPSAFAASPLANHPSPYVRLHADDAVEWQLWNADVLKRARNENRLIFVSIGYFACHWCHVMREESFDHETVARVLNGRFIPVKVDRELNPALDAYLMTFVQMTRGHGGWPLNVFLTPEGYPLTGMVYLPRTDFLQVINTLDANWRRQPDHLNTLARDAFEFRQKIQSRSQPMPTAQRLSSLLLDRVKQQGDELAGGIGDQAKFPRAPLLLALLEQYRHQRDPWLRDFLHLTLDQMAENGLHDVIGGGFFRYTIDPQWHTPHYEKMLYTNAGLAQVYARASVILGRPDYLHIATETLEFMLRDMWSSRGFVSALSAQDNNGVDGGAYLWREDELQQALTPQQWHKVETAWVFIEVPESAGILPVGKALGDEWQPIRQRLQKKQRRHHTPRDDKVLPGWNGYALSALAAVVRLTDRQDLIAAGDRLHDLLHARAREGLARKAGGIERRFVEDYAFLVQGMLDWAEVRGKNNSESARHLIGQALPLFAAGGGWRLSDELLIPRPNDALNIADAQLPSAEIVMLKLIRRLRLAEHREFNRYLERFRQQVDGRMLESPLDFASHIAYRLTPTMD